MTAGEYIPSAEELGLNWEQLLYNAVKARGDGLARWRTENSGSKRYYPLRTPDNKQVDATLYPTDTYQDSYVSADWPRDVEGGRRLYLGQGRASLFRPLDEDWYHSGYQTEGLSGPDVPEELSRLAFTIDIALPRITHMGSPALLKEIAFWDFPERHYEGFVKPDGQIDGLYAPAVNLESTEDAEDYKLVRVDDAEGNDVLWWVSNSRFVP